MNLTLTVMEIVAPVFMLAAVGFTWVKLGFEYRIQFVTRLATTLAVPCLIFVALMQTEIAGDDLGRFTLATIAANLALTVVFWVFVRVTGIDQRSYLSPLVFGNTGNLGLPLCIFAFGQAGLGYAVVFLSVTALWSFTYGIYLFAGRGSLGTVLRQPMVWATILGAVFLWQGWQTPTFLTNGLELIGQMAVPMMLVTLGVAVARLTPDKIGKAIWLSLIKLVVSFALGWSVAILFELTDEAFGVLVLQMVTPVAVTSYLLAERFGADSNAVAGMVVTSTLMSVAALPLVLAILL
ncbi:AEC family transporter [Phaeobacter gallaeciensis]|uniref:AEC family transporter n=2 Tax=Roseobacteraceae TaxID=2854170 RepID=A0A366X9B3_9RHOB|nr:AEC family transporter [Phaeobacter gallaeciensis]MBT3141892.1 AEC family transporter [Falsiruegeria litorea]MBT8168761.1 AEC family transporter [Falsiruegeria litorea]RBW59985.1 AEC family transporter [Phaeobacter gallaeciensis]